MSSSLSTSLSQIILRSEPDTLAPETLSSQLHDLTQSMSLPALNDLTLSDVLGDIVSSWGSSLFSRALLSRSQSSHKPRPSTLVVAFNVLKIQFLSFKRRIRGLEAENISLEHANKMLRSDAEAREEELSSLRADFYTEKYQTKVFAQHVKADKNKITQLNDKIDQAEKFIMAMVDLKLHEPVLYRAAKAVKEGDAAEDALIDAVKEASTQKLSAWSRIVPAIVGPRTPEHYVSAINLTLKARKDLRKRDKVCEFWKKIAKRDPTNATMVTPSASVLSDAGELVEEVMPKPAVLDELLTALENGDSLLRAKQNVPGIVPTAKSVQVLSSVQSESFAGTANLNTSVLQAETGPARVSSNSSATPPVAREQAIQVTPNKTGTTCSTKLIVDHVNKYPISPPRFKLTTPQATPVKSQTSSPIKSPPITPTKEMYIPTYATNCPTPKSASKQTIFQLRKVPSTPVRSRLSSPLRFKRPPLQNINLNQPVAKAEAGNSDGKPAVSVSRSKATARNKKRKPSAKDLEKRHGVMLEEKVQVSSSKVTMCTMVPHIAEMEIYDPVVPSFSSSTVSDCSYTEQKSNSGRDLDVYVSTPRPTETLDAMTDVSSSPSTAFPRISYPLSASGLPLDLSPEGVEHNALLAAQALGSLERICAAFSSGSLGSLEITDDSNYDSDDALEDLQLINMNEQQYDGNSNRSSDLQPIWKALNDKASLNRMGQQEGSGEDQESSPVANHPPRAATPTVRSHAWTPAGHSRRRDSTSSSSSFLSSSSGSIYSPSKTSVKQSMYSTKASTVRHASIARGRTLKPTYTQYPLSFSPKEVVSATSEFVPFREHNISDGKAVCTPPRLNIASGMSFEIKKPSMPVLQHKNNVHRTPPPTHAKPSIARTVCNSFELSIHQPKVSVPHIKPRSQTMDAVSPLPPSFSTPKPESLTRTPSRIKPRSSTINTVSPLPPIQSLPTQESLSPTTCPSKPRSNTINTFSPSKRSPLSNNVVIAPSPTKPRSHTTGSSTFPSTKQSPLAHKSAIPSPTKIQANGKSLNSTHKANNTTPTSPIPRRRDPAPPNAAFMHQAVMPTANYSPNRLTTSIAPLIPNWPSTSNSGMLSPTRCRQLLRRELNMIR